MFLVLIVLSRFSIAPVRPRLRAPRRRRWLEVSLRLRIALRLTVAASCAKRSGHGVPLRQQELSVTERL